jgi:multiple sugar transport system substrate-binding protein
LQPTADTALTKFIDQPDQIDAILREWQANAEKVFKG